MNLKELIKEIELINSINKTEYSTGKLRGMKKIVEAVDGYMFKLTNFLEEEEDWQKLKKLLGVK